MSAAIMQPYFFPYIGYFQLIAAVDVFVIYDNIKYTKKGWINRNRFLQNGKDVLFSLPLKADSDFKDVAQRRLADDFNRDKLLNQIGGAYRRAPHFAETMPLVERAVRFEEPNLFGFIEHSIRDTCAHLGIGTEIVAASTLPIDHTLKGQDKVLALCAALKADSYINPIGGLELYSKAAFAERGVELKFQKPILVEYPQFDAAFVPWLSIIDVMMFNPVEAIRGRMLPSFEFV